MKVIFLDDGADMVELRPWLVHTDPMTGLVDSDVERALFLFASSHAGIKLAGELAVGYTPGVPAQRYGTKGIES